MKAITEKGSRRAGGVQRIGRRKETNKSVKLTGAVRVAANWSLHIKSILVPTDFSAGSEKAIAYAVPMARRFGAKLTLLHVVEPVTLPTFAKSQPVMLDAERVSADSQKHLARITRDLGIEPELMERTAVRFGRAGDEIAQTAASLKADLIIIATHGYTGLKHVILGSTAERVMRHAPCPVLVVRPSEHEFVTHRLQPSTRS